MKNRKLRWMLASAAMLLAAGFGAGNASAKVVEPTGKGFLPQGDRREIILALQEDHYAKLVSGKTYKLSGMINMSSGDFIDATGATIICDTTAVRNIPKKTKYKAFKNIHIKGGTWKQKNKAGFNGSSFQFVHGTGVVMEDMDIQCTNYYGHAIELIACRNVKINNCKITAQGKNPADGREEMIQIDVAAPATAPTIKTRYGSKYVNGAACKNVTISNCTVKGAKAVCANYAMRDGGKWLKNYHSNIKVIDCSLTSTGAQALNLANCLGITVKGCTIRSKSSASYAGSSYSDGCTVFFSGTAPAAVKNAVYVFTDNTIYGTRHALCVSLGGSKKAKSITVTGNRLYCRRGKGDALAVDKSAAKKTVVKSNKSFKW